MNATDGRIILVVIFAMLLAFVIGYTHGVLRRRDEALTDPEQLARWLYARLDSMRLVIPWDRLPRDLQEAYRVAAEDLIADWRTR